MKMVDVGRPRKFKTKEWIATVGEANQIGEFKRICQRDGISVSERLYELVKTYNKEHGAGNDQYQLENWQQAPDFKAFPAFMSPLKQWGDTIRDADPKEFAAIDKRLNEMRSVIETRKIQERKR